MDAWGLEDEAVPTPEIPKRKPWGMLGVKDKKDSEAINALLMQAQGMYGEHGKGLAESFKIPFNSDLEDQVHFYNSDGTIGAERMRKKQGFVGAYTQPNSRAIMLPVRDILKLDPDKAQQLILHEMMHSQGLGEDPGASGSDKISAAVAEYIKRARGLK